MATFHFSRAASWAMMAALQALFDAGSTGATIKFYTGSMPTGTLPQTGAETGISSQILLGTCTMPTSCGSETPTGSLTIGTIVGDSAADASGTATWARIADSAGLTVVDVDVGVSGGGAVIQMVTNVLVAGGPIAFTSFVFRMT